MCPSVVSVEAPGSSKQGSLAAVVELLVPTVVSSRLPVPGSGPLVQLQGRRDGTREGLRCPPASCLPGLSSSLWPVFSGLERVLLSATSLSRLADVGSKG